jgi:predicted MFS family arabinose efflux permease
MAAGSLVAAAAIATRVRPKNRTIVAAAFVYSSVLLLVSWLPWYAATAAALAVLGGSQVVYYSLNTTTFQLGSRPEYHGRMLALGSWLIMGTSPIGGAITGVLAEAIGIRATIAIDGAICLAACVGAALWLRRARPEEPLLHH